MQNKYNLIALIVIQVSNALVPLVLFPYILHVMGSSSYSSIVTSEALMFIMYTFTLYSFEINGVSTVVKLRSDVHSNGLSKFFINVFIVRILILLTILLLVLIAYYYYNSLFIELLLLWLLYPLSFVFQSTYFFQGLEKNILLSLFVVISRVLTFFLISQFIFDSSDIFLVPFIIGSMYMLAGLASFIYIWKSYQVTTKLIDFLYMKELLYEGKEIFLGNISVVLFRGSNVLLLGMLTNDSLAISIYSIAEKFIKSLQATMRPLNQYYFPKAIHILKDLEYPNKYSLEKIFKLSIIQLVFLVFLSFILFLIYYFRENIIFINSYTNIEHIFTVIIIMLPAIFVGILNFMYGSVGLNYLNSKKYYAKAIVTTGILSLCISTILIAMFHELGAAFAFFGAEFLLFVFVISKYIKKDIK